MQPVKLEIDEEKNLLIKFDPTHKRDLNNWVAEEILAIRYLEHPQVDNLSLRGEVHYPNLKFETMDLDFGCILNDTEVIRYVPITNCSPLAVKFRWFFVMNNEGSQIRYRQRSCSKELFFCCSFFVLLFLFCFFPPSCFALGSYILCTGLARVLLALATNY